jgi:ParB family chromosome partitioning protein
MGHVRPLLALENEDDMYDTAEKIRREKMSVREVERYVKELTGGAGAKKKTKKEPAKDPLIRDIENRMTSKLGTKVTLSGKTIAISYGDTADLNRILELLGMIEESDVTAGY